MTQPAVSIALAAFVLVTGCAAPAAGPILDDTDFVSIPHVPHSGVLVDGKLTPEEWENALTFRDEFVLAEGPRAGTHPFVLRFMGDEHALYVGVTVLDLPAHTFEFPDNSTTTYSDEVTILLTGPTGALKRPSDQVGAAHVRRGGTADHDGYWDGQAWVLQSDRARGVYGDGHPTSGRWSPGSWENDTIHFEMYIARESDLVLHDGFQMPGPGSFRACLQFSRGTDEDQERALPNDIYTDTYPGEGASKGTELDPSTWLKLRFDY